MGRRARGGKKVAQRLGPASRVSYPHRRPLSSTEGTHLEEFYQSPGGAYRSAGRPPKQGGSRKVLMHHDAKKSPRQLWRNHA